MSFLIKTPQEIKKMRVAGRLAASVLEMINSYIKPGISTDEINNICHEYITKIKKAIAAPLGYQGFPKSICTSINEVVCHGIPSCTDKLKNGDIINIDVTIIKNGLYADTSKMFIVGKTTDLNYRLCQITKKSLYLAIQKIRPGLKLRKIGQTIQNFVEKNNFSVVREYCGHGIGKSFHERPHVLHYDANDDDFVLEPGMIFTIEPMVNSGKHQVYTDSDGWTVKTKDKSLSAQYEHTIIVTKNGCEIATLRSNENLSKIFNCKNKQF